MNERLLFETDVSIYSSLLPQLSGIGELQKQTKNCCHAVNLNNYIIMRCFQIFTQDTLALETNPGGLDK